MLRVMLAALMMAPALGAQLVDGHVVNAATGAGIAGVRVNLFHGGEVAYSANTDSQGRFRIEAIKDGAYTLDYRAPGFSSPYPMGGGGQRPFQVAAGGDPVHLEARLQPLPKVSGRVLDAAGKPVPNASLWVIGYSRACSKPWCFPVLQQSRTDDRGEYSITDVNYPGTWLLSASAPASFDPPASRDGQRLGWAQTFYPGATEFQLGAKVAVEPGGELWNVDIKLAAVPVHGVRGRVLDARGAPMAKVPVTLGSSFGPGLHRETGADGSFEFASVAEAEWRLSASGEQNGVKL
jgi:Carboxypeptidase regulatory-like domain